MPSSRSCAHCLVELPEQFPGNACPYCGTQLPADTSIESSEVAPAPPRVIALDASTRTSPSVREAVQETATLPAERAPRDRQSLNKRPVPVFSKYALQRVIGSGGMGLVYQGIQKHTQRQVAVKVIQQLGLLDKSHRLRFERETLALGKLSHPCIVTVFDGGEENDTPFLAMEYLSGGTLAERIRKEKQLPVQDAVSIVAAVSEAVAAAHDAGILHRDIKPSNILLTQDGTPKIADFGLAKLLYEANDSLTHTGAIVGTPSYMAPEQLDLGGDSITHLADVYSLGATLFHALTGQPPFDAGSPMATAMRVRGAPIPTLSEHISDICPVLDAIVAKAMERYPGDRYPDAQTLAKDLRAWLAGTPTLARPKSFWQRQYHWLRRHSGKVAAAVLIPLCIAGALGIKQQAEARQREADAKAQQEADPLWQLEQRLERGERVQLIGPSGSPAYAKLRYGLGNYYSDISNDGSFAVSAINSSTLLELVPDPKCDHYRFGLDFRHNGREVEKGEVGLYIGYHAEPIRLGEHADVIPHLIELRYSDFWLMPPEFAQARQRQGLLPTDAIYWPASMFPEDVTSPQAHMQYRRFPRPPANTQPAPWRHIQLEVSHQGVIVSWADDAQQHDENQLPLNLREVLRIPVEQIHQATLYQNEQLARVIPKSGIELQPWHPRRGLGLYVRDTSASYRNVYIEPLLK